MTKIPNTPEFYAVDIALPTGQDYAIANNDLQMVYGADSIGYAVIRRLLTEYGSWDADRTFGSQLWEMLKTKGVGQFTSNDLLGLVQEAARSMITEGRISKVNSASIIETTSIGIVCEINISINENIAQTVQFLIPT